jgi:wyosine [tRNA(Phe)-imidazoG37] synthetase (radical SAM superfamily)
MNTAIDTVESNLPAVVPKAKAETAFGCPRQFLNNRFVYTVVSPRARGLSVGVNMNPDKKCNFDCAYCEVNRCAPSRETVLDVEVMAKELERTLQDVLAGRLREMACYRRLPEDLLRLRQVTLSGDGEPTLCPHFAGAVQAVAHVRARLRGPFFKIVLLTNSTGLHLPEVLAGLESLTPRDEVWVKLDAGTPEYFRKVNQAGMPFEQVLASILTFARRRPVVVQSLFCTLGKQGPTPIECAEYAQRLLELKRDGAQIQSVQIYSATRPTWNSACGHLSLSRLSQIAKLVRETTGLKTEVS